MLPQTREELLGVTGYTEAIFDKYGGEKFLEIFRHYAQLKQSVEAEEMKKKQAEFAKQKAAATMAALKQSKTYGLLDDTGGGNDLYCTGEDDDAGGSYAASMGYDFSKYVGNDWFFIKEFRLKLDFFIKKRSSSTSTTEWMAAKSSSSSSNKRKFTSNNNSNKKFKSTSEECDTPNTSGYGSRGGGGSGYKKSKYFNKGGGGYGGGKKKFYFKKKFKKN